MESDTNGTNSIRSRVYGEWKHVDDPLDKKLGGIITSSTNCTWKIPEGDLPASGCLTGN